ncbi:magnesium transporter NIPA-domain-containing protein [Mycena leptocephala]|nr:magnesium transporter NIPA-domain-containing protein [Mycena leptocephala]
MTMPGSFAIGTSSVTVITKMGLTASADRTVSTDNMVFLRCGGLGWAFHLAVANFGAYTFAPPIMVTPLGALSVIVAAVFASFLLNERLGRLGHVGCTLYILRSSITVLHAPEDQELETVTQFLEYSVELGFLFYFFTVLIFSLIMAYDVAPRHGRTNLVYISIASLVGSVSDMFVKGLSIALKLTFSGENQFVYPSMYLFVVIAGVCIVVQLNYANKALDLFSVNLASSTVSLLSGFIVTFLGVHILNLAMLDESEAASRAASNLSRGGRVSPRSGEETVQLERLEEEEEEYGEDLDETTALRVGGLGSTSSPRLRAHPQADDLYYAYSIQREVPVVDLT